MFTYANPYDFEPRVAEGGQVCGMDIVLDGIDEFGGQDVETGLALSFTVKHLSRISLTFLLYNLHICGHCHKC